MRLMASTIGVAVLLSAFCAPASALAGSVIHYGPDSKFSGYFVKPDGKGPFPGLVMVHEWWGLNDNVRRVADELSGAGYVVLAVDLFGKSTTDPAEAFKMVRAYNQISGITEMVSAASYLRTRPFVKPTSVGSIGWCFGGAQSLQLALNDPKLAAAVIYYGQPVTDPSDLSKIKAAILGIFGEADQSIPIADVRTFEKALQKAGVLSEIYTYPNAGHAFASPTHGPNYRAEDAADAWAKATAFLAKYVKGG